MKKTIYYLLLFFLVGCAATRVHDLREFPTYRLGLIQIGWMDPNWHIDVWVNSQPFSPPSFTLLPGWQKEIEMESDEISIYAEAWVWDRGGQKLIVAKTNFLGIKASVSRDWWHGYGWRVWFNSNDFVAIKQLSFQH